MFKLTLQKTDLLQQLLASSNATPVKFNGQVYRCGYCLERFISPKKLKSHTEEDHANDTITHTQRERVVKLDVTTLACKLCGNSINSIQELIEHLKEDHEKKFQTEDVSTLILPFIYDDGLKCAICGINLSNSRSLSVHMNTHFGKFVCHICSASYIHLESLKYHLKSTHNEGMRAKIKTRVYNKCYKCSHCGSGFQRLAHLRDHLKTEHGETKYYLCHICKSTFNRSVQLWVHIRRDHLKERNHKCNLCEKSFYSKVHLTNHLTVHTGEANHLCDVCAKTFTTKHSLSTHRRTQHTNDKLFKCAHCNLAYAQKALLRAHLKSKHERDC